MRSSNDGIRSRRIAVTTALGLLVAAVGCGQRGPDRYRVHGTVTHAGVPVPLGRIVFEPDLSRGNRGPQGFAPIENGRFDTAAKFCQGTVGGATIVRIEGFEMIGHGEDATTPGRRLFETYETRIDLPRKSLARDFDVPAQPAR